MGFSMGFLPQVSRNFPISMEFSAVADCEARPCSPRLVPLCRGPPLPRCRREPEAFAEAARYVQSSEPTRSRLGADSVSPRNWGKTLHSSPFHVIPLVNHDFPSQEPCVDSSAFLEKKA